MEIVGSIILSISQSILFYGKEIGISMLLFAIICNGIGFYILHKKNKIQNRAGMLLIIPILLLSSTYFIFANKTFSHSEPSYKKLYVSSGDTLWNIAQQQKNTNLYFEDKDIRSIIDEIKYTNNLNTSNLEIGQELNIPII